MGPAFRLRITAIRASYLTISVDCCAMNRAVAGNEARLCAAIAVRDHAKAARSALDDGGCLLLGRLP
jgi:hypothetical protein